MLTAGGHLILIWHALRPTGPTVDRIDAVYRRSGLPDAQPTPATPGTSYLTAAGFTVTTDTHPRRINLVNRGLAQPTIHHLHTPRPRHGTSSTPTPRPRPCHRSRWCPCHRTHLHSHRHTQRNTLRSSHVWPQP